MDQSFGYLEQFTDEPSFANADSSTVHRRERYERVEFSQECVKRRMGDLPGSVQKIQAASKDFDTRLPR